VLLRMGAPVPAGSVGHLFGTFSIGCLLSRAKHAQSLPVRPKDVQPPVPAQTRRAGYGADNYLEAFGLGRSDRLLQTVSDCRLEGIVESPCVALLMDVRSEGVCGDPRLRSRCRRGAGSKKFEWQRQR